MMTDMVILEQVIIMVIMDVVQKRIKQVLKECIRIFMVCTAHKTESCNECFETVRKCNAMLNS